MNKQLRGNFKYLRFRQRAVCQLLLLLLQTSRTNCKTWLGAVFGTQSPPSCQYWRVGKGAGALDLESTAKHDILSNGSDHYLQSFVSVPVIHVRHAKQGWFSFLVEWIVNPERFLLLFSLSFLITHTPTQWVWPLHQFHLVWSETVEWVGKPKPICLDCFCLHPKSGPLSDFCLVSHLV